MGEISMANNSMKLLVDLRLKYVSSSRESGFSRFEFLVLIDENTYIGFNYVEIEVCAEYL